MKPVVMISFEDGGQNGGPYVSHERITRSPLSDFYDFVPLSIPKGRRGIVNPRLVRCLVRQIRATNPDLVHIHGLQLAGFHVALAAFLARKPIVLGVHGSSSEALDFPKWKRLVVAGAEVLTIGMSTKLFAVSEYVATWPRVRRGSRRFVGVVANLPPPFPTRSTGGGIREELGIAGGDIVVVSTGRITREKGYMVLREAICRLGVIEGVNYVIAGNGEFLPELRRGIEECGLDSCVFLLGYRADVMDILLDSDVFVLCSFHETFSMSLVEAGFAGLPCVAPDVGGVPEVVEHNHNGILVRPGDVEGVVNALERLLGDEEYRLELGMNARRRAVERFSEGPILTSLDAIYGSVLDGR